MLDQPSWIIAVLDKFVESKKFIEWKNMLETVTIDDGIRNTSYRTLNHWDTKGIIMFSRRHGTEKGWRAVTGKELIWFRIVQNLRKTGVELSTVKDIRSKFMSEQNSNKFLFYAFLAHYGWRITLAIDSDGNSTLLPKEELHTYTLCEETIQTLITVNFSDIVKSEFGISDLAKKFPQLTRSIPDSLADILSRYDSGVIEIHKKAGGITHYAIAIESDDISKNNISKDFNGTITSQIRGGVIVRKLIRKTIKPRD